MFVCWVEALSFGAYRGNDFLDNRLVINSGGLVELGRYVSSSPFSPLSSPKLISSVQSLQTPETK